MANKWVERISAELAISKVNGSERVQNAVYIAILHENILYFAYI